MLIAYNYRLYTPPEPEERAKVLALTSVTVIDGMSATLLEQATILITRDRIWRIEKDGEPPQEAQVIDMTGLFVMPALMDAAIFFEAPVGEERGYTPGEWEWELTRTLPGHRRDLLAAGVTTVQGIGGGLDTSVRTRSLIQSQELAGPRLFISGPIMTAPMGFPGRDEFPFRVDAVTAVIETPAEVRQWVQELALLNVDQVSISYTNLGGNGPRLSREVMRAAIEEAHTFGRRAIVYTAALDEAREAVLAGADALVGGVSLTGEEIDGELIRLMKARGTVYIPALAAVEARQAPGSGREALATAQSNARLVYQAGIPVVAGSAAASTNMMLGQSLRTELVLLVAAGLTPAEAIACATVEAARFLQAESLLGVLREGSLADLIVLDANPLDDIRALNQVRMVIQNGIIVVDYADQS
jgi:enamidase